MDTNNQDKPRKSIGDIRAKMMEQQTRRANLKTWEANMKKHIAQKQNSDQSQTD